jgi:hypothetical protein
MTRASEDVFVSVLTTGESWIGLNDVDIGREDTGGWDASHLHALKWRGRVQRFPFYCAYGWNDNN